MFTTITNQIAHGTSFRNSSQKKKFFPIENYEVLLQNILLSIQVVARVKSIYGYIITIEYVVPVYICLILYLQFDEQFYTYVQYI